MGVLRRRLRCVGSRLGMVWAVIVDHVRGVIRGANDGRRGRFSDTRGVGHGAVVPGGGCRQCGPLALHPSGHQLEPLPVSVPHLHAGPRLEAAGHGRPEPSTERATLSPWNPSRNPEPCSPRSSRASSASRGARRAGGRAAGIRSVSLITRRSGVRLPETASHEPARSGSMSIVCLACREHDQPGPARSRLNPGCHSSRGRSARSFPAVGGRAARGKPRSSSMPCRMWPPAPPRIRCA